MFAAFGATVDAVIESIRATIVTTTTCSLALVPRATRMLHKSRADVGPGVYSAAIGGGVNLKTAKPLILIEIHGYNVAMYHAKPKRVRKGHLHYVAT